MSALPNKPQRAEFGWPGGDRPGAVVFGVPVAPEIHTAIVAVVSRVLPEFGRKTTLRALTPPDGAIGRYRLATSEAACFVRVSARWGEPQLEQAITDWLRAHGVAVNHLEFAGLHLEFADADLRLDVRELLDARHDNGSLAEIKAVAAALAEAHRWLRDFPLAESVRDHAARRFNHLATIRDTIAAALAREDWSAFSEDPAWAQEHAAWLRELVSTYAPRCDELPGAQCLHAQVHRGNVLFQDPDATPMLLDFEEAVQTFAPVAWDLAYFVQRFCLADAPEPALLRERLVAIRAAYDAPVPGLAEMMRHTAWFSMAVLVDYHQRGIISPRDEYDKFVRLETQARELAPLLGEHFDA